MTKESTAPKKKSRNGSKCDPILTFKKRLQDQKIITTAEVAEVDRATQQEIEDSVKFAMQGSPLPFSEIGNYVYSK